MNIVISGTVAVGKTTVVNYLQQYYKNNENVHFMFEKIDDQNPMLSFYYQNYSDWSFLIQIDFLLDRFKNALNADKNNINNKWFHDRHFLDDYIWTSVDSVIENMSSFQIATYKIINEHLAKKIEDENSKVDYFFLIKIDFETTLNRLKQRGRSNELQVDINYWKNLYDTYYNNLDIKKYLKSNSKNFIVIDADDMSPSEIANFIIESIE